METKYYSITALNRAIKNMFDSKPELSKVFIKGEISNFKHHTRGHMYFTLKDENSRISAVMFNSSISSLGFEPEDGMKVLVEGRVSVYEATGGYQIYVEKMEMDGLGNLYLEYERLKKELESQGLFAKEHKKAIPKYPKRIGIITAPTGAAIRDILSTIKRRYPICETILFPALVQGIGAKESVTEQIYKAQDFDLDVIICGRGGGSIEDLWAFNEECVARAIYQSSIPIISAVGHEIDFTIADFVADLRAPTPTGAAEMAVPNLMDLQLLLEQYKIRLHENVKGILSFNKKKINSLLTSYVLKNPMALYEVKEQRLDALIEKSNQSIKQILYNAKYRVQTVTSNYVLKNPLVSYELKKEKINMYQTIVQKVIKTKLNNEEHRYELLLNKLHLLNPISVLEKGYSLVSKEDKIVSSKEQLQVGDTVKIQFKESSATARIEEV